MKTTRTYIIEVKRSQLSKLLIDVCDSDTINVMDSAHSRYVIVSIIASRKLDKQLDELYEADDVAMWMTA
jgi:hypothetical protein